MKKLLMGMVLLALSVAAPMPSTAGVDIHIGFPLPPPIVFPAPPAVVVLPDTPDVYVVPEVEADIFFWDGWWWRPWEGRWYRSQYYDRGWVYYDEAPDFYFYVDPGWRGYYKRHDWYGHPWRYERIPNKRLHKYWKSWKNDRRWERHKRWDVQGYKPRPEKDRRHLWRQRRDEYRNRPEVRRHEQQRQERRERGEPRRRTR